FSRRFCFLYERSDVINGEADLQQLRGGRLEVVRIELINGLVELVFVGRVALASGEELVPGVAAAEPDDEIFRGQFEKAQNIDEQSNQLGVRSRIRLADDVCVQ